MHQTDKEDKQILDLAIALANQMVLTDIPDELKFMSLITFVREYLLRHGPKKDLETSLRLMYSAILESNEESDFDTLTIH